MNDNVNTGQQEIIQCLKAARELYVIVSLCTGSPYVVCDQETFDDEILIYLEEKEARRKVEKLTQEGIPVNSARLENRQLLVFYTNLYTMGINALMVNSGGNRCLIQLAEFVRRSKPELDKEKKVWVENPALHLTALYYMQELRRQPGKTAGPQMREWQDEIANDFSKGSFILPVQKESGGLAAIKLNDEVFQAVFTDILEFQKFNREGKLRPVVVNAGKLPQIMAAETKGVVINPMGVRMPLHIKKTGPISQELTQG